MSLSAMCLARFCPRLSDTPTHRLGRLARAGGVLALAAVVLPWRPGVVVGASMAPTLNPGQFFVYARDPLFPRPLRRGDVVVVRIGGQTCVKRVFAMDGDQFWVCQGGRRADLHARLLDPATPIRQWRERFPRLIYQQRSVPRGEVYVVGDGLYSQDSRELGSVPAAEVLGHVVYPRVDGAGPGLNTVKWHQVPRPPRPLRVSRS